MSRFAWFGEGQYFSSPPCGGEVAEQQTGVENEREKNDRMGR